METQLSIIIPVYNVEQYLETCLDSVLVAVGKLAPSQTYEIICVDDGATDSSPAILDNYAANNPYIRVIHKSNGGLSDARNAGMDAANGEYIYFLDSDDSITPDTFVGMLEQVRLHPGVDMVVAGAMTSEGNPRFSMSIRKYYPDYTEDREWIKCMMILQNIPMVAWNKLLRREMIKKAHLRFEVGIYCEDQPWNWLLAKQIHSVAFYRQDTYNYLIRPNSIIKNPANLAKRWKDLLHFWNIWMSNIDNYLPDSQRFAIYYMTLCLWLSPDPCSSLEDIKMLFEELGKKCSERQRAAIWLTTHLPIYLLLKIGVLQRSLLDFFGQAECRKYDDRGIGNYFLKKKHY